MFQTSPSQRTTLFKGLRLKSPTGEQSQQEQHPDQVQRTSPLRQTLTGQQYTDGQSFSEIQPIESQTEMLRREIQVKEAALDRISDSKDRLRMRISNTLGLNPSISGNFRQNNLASSISQTSIYSKDLYQTNQFQKRDITPPSRDHNRKSTSPLRQQPRLPISNNYPVDSFQSLQKQSSTKELLYTSFQSKQQVASPISANVILQSESLQQLQTDNSQLQRRLNLVVAELDRMNREKHQQQQHLAAISDETDYFRKALEDEQKPDKNSDLLHEEIFVSRENNKRVQSDILKADRDRQDSITQLRLYQAERERRVQNCEELSTGLQNKLAIMNNIENEIQQCKEKIERVNVQLKSAGRKISDDDRSNQEIQIIINRLQRERDDLHSKLGQLSENYNSAVAELSRERQAIEAHNKRHVQLLSSKAIFMRLIQMTYDRKQYAFNEIIQYCKFDNNCHRALNQFSKVLQSCGHYQMRIGLKRWFQNALKPLATRQQGQKLAIDLYLNKLKTKTFRRWMNSKLRSQNLDSGMRKGANVVCQKLAKWSSQDVATAFTIWRDHFKLSQQREKRLSIVISRQHNNRRRQCFESWFIETSYINEQIRLQILAKTFVAKQLKLLTFSQFHKNTCARRDSRLSKLRHILKAWRDSVAYRKYMMAQNVAASHLRRHLNSKLLLSCLYQLRHHKEAQKFEVVFSNLDQIVQPAIESLTSQIEDEAARFLKQRQLSGLNCIANHTYTSIQSYFTHWRNVNEMAKQRIATNLRLIVTTLYRNKLHRAFNQWNNKQKLLTRNIYEERIVLDLQREKTELSQEISSLKSSIDDENRRIDFNQIQRLKRAADIYKRRMLYHFMRRWSEKTDLINQLEGKAGFVIQKIRHSLCEQAFAILKSKVKMCRQDDLDQQRAEYYIQTREQRRMRQILNAFCQYHVSYTNQKKNIRLALANIDIYLQRKAFFKWNDQGNLKRVNLLADEQNNETSAFDSLNKTLGIVTSQLSDAGIQNQQLKSNLILQGQRVLANTFQRYYYIKAQRGIEQWIKVINHQKHLESILKRQIQHKEKSIFYQVKAAFKNWIAQSKIHETKAEITRTHFAIADSVQMTRFNKETHESTSNELNIQTLITNQKIDSKTVKVNASIQKIIEKNDKCHYQSNLRHIFNTWSEFTKRQKRFCLAIERVISQSLYQQGFSNINAFSQDKKLTRHQNNSLQQMRRMFWRKNCERAIALWNTKCHQSLTNKVQVTFEIIQQEVQAFERKVESVKEHSCSNGNAAIFEKMKQKTLLATWRNAVLWEKSLRVRIQQADEMQRNHATRIAIKRWYERSVNTVKTQNLVDKFRLRLQFLKSKAIFTKVVNGFRGSKLFANCLSNLAAKFDNRMKQSAFEMISNFSDSHHCSNTQDKTVAIRSIYNCLHQLYLRRMTSNLACLKSKTMVQKRRDKKIGNMLGHWHSRRRRDAFFKWKNQAHFATTVIEVNESGPVVEEVLEFQIQQRALVSFMQDQAYTPKEIDQARQVSQDGIAEQLKRSVARIQHYTQQDDLYLKPKMFDRWKEYVKMRKLLRYILRNMENKLKPVTADLSIAFNRWKFAQGNLIEIQAKKQAYLNGAERSNLVKRCANNTQRINDLNSLVDQGETFMGHMSLQRDELVDNYIKSQRLAIALGRDNLERGMHRSLNQMETNAHLGKRRDFETLLERNIDLIANLKQRIQDFETENVAVANENEELRQFSLDGYQIAKNVQSLSNERERLSVDLADKASIIKRLLSENENLQASLRSAQDHAVVLVQQSQTTMRRIQQQRPLDNY